MDGMRRWGGPWIWSLLVIAAVMRFWHLGYPAEKVFDETHYVFAASVMAGLEPPTGLEAWKNSDYPIIARTPDPNFSHPPLGKALIVASIKAFGNTPWAWRFPSAVASIVSLILIYLIARRLTRDDWVAWLATFFMCFDMMHVCQSRIAMLDMFLLVAALMLMGSVLLLIEDPKSKWGNAGAVLAIGIGLSTKFTMVLTISAFGLAYMVLGRNHNWWKRMFHAGALAVAGALVFSLWAFYFMANGFTWLEWAFLQWVAVVKVLGPLKSHPYSSLPIAWPFNHKPVWYYYKGGDMPEGIVALGNPVLWWGFLWAAYVLLVERRLYKGLAPTYLLIWYSVTYLPLILVLWRRSDASFLFHMLPSTPPMMIGLAYALVREVRDRRWHVAFCGLALGVFGFFAPVVFAVPASGDYYRLLSNLISF